MDASSAVQTVAQAVQAATQQAQQAASHSSPSARPQSASNSAIDNLTCQWQGCGERCDSAEALYDHVCERHVGRKSTNNLNLTCQWGACRTTTVKRDHITSHIRVHVPLKPHKCDFCGKAFKRPQDLKKHVKTHADDSVLMNSPQHGSGRGLGSGGLGQPNGKPSTYYGVGGHDASLGNPYPSYQPSMPNGTNGNSFPQVAAGNQYAGYGSVSYPTSSALADIQSMDTRRRAIEALNDFLGDIKRRAIDPNNYYDVGHRLQSNSLPLPVGTGYNTGYNNSSYNSNYSTASLLESFNSSNMGGHGNTQAGVATHGYSLPLPNARTKTDLQDIDRFLEQLQTTVYEASRGYEGSNAAAAAGVQQPGLHTQFAGEFGMNHPHQYSRISHSPPNTFQAHLNSHGMDTSTTSSMNGVSSTASALDTPALTPASVSSYTSSGHSPMSSHGRDSYHGRDSFGSAAGSMYPNVPSAPGMSDLGPNYPTTTSAPASGIASGMGGLDHRRGSGGFLQRQAPDVKDQDTEMTDADDGSRTPKSGDAQVKPDSSLDPALREEAEARSPESASTPAAASEVEDKRQEEWVENIRLIEALRKWVGERLKSGDFDHGEATGSSDRSKAVGHGQEEEERDVDMKETAKMAAEQLAEKLAAAIESENEKEKSKQQEQAAAMAGSEVKYPTLPSAA